MKVDKSNNISQTHNDILLELNNLLKNEDANKNNNPNSLSNNPLVNEDKNKEGNKQYIFDEEKVILEENNENTSIMKTNKQFNAQSNVDNESMKSK